MFGSFFRHGESAKSDDWNGEPVNEEARRARLEDGEIERREG